MCKMSRSSTSRFRLLALVVALGLLSASVFATKNKEARDCRRQIERLEEAISEHRAEHGDRLPTSVEELAPQYVSELPCCPSTNTMTYTLVPSGNNGVDCRYQDSHDRWLFGSSP